MIWSVLNLKYASDAMMIIEQFILNYTVYKSRPLQYLSQVTGTPIPLDTHPPEHSSPWNTHPTGTLIPLELPSPWNTHPPGTPTPLEHPSPWNSHPLEHPPPCGLSHQGSQLAAAEDATK